MKPVRVSSTTAMGRLVSELWRKSGDSGAHSWLKLDLGEDEHVRVFSGDHKSPWVSDGRVFDNFDEARKSSGLPEPA